MMRIGRLRILVAGLGAVALITATARCGSAQEKSDVQAREQTAKAAPFVVRSGGLGGGSYLGVYISEVDADDVSRLGLAQERGAMVEDVSDEGPAQKAGVEKDDVIVEWNGSRVESAMQLRRLVSETPAGREVELGLIRDGDKRDLSVTIGERESLVRSFSFRGPAPGQVEELRERLRSSGERMRLHSPGVGGVYAFIGGGRMGVGIQSLGDQLGEYFGLSGRTGVLVTSVTEDSPAEQAGLEAGDVILSVGGEPVDGTVDLARKVREAEQGPIAVGILRDRKERTVTVELPEASELRWESPPGAALMRVPEAMEGAMMMPELLELDELPELDFELWTVPEPDVHMEWRGPESGVRIRVPADEPVRPLPPARIST